MYFLDMLLICPSGFDSQCDRPWRLEENSHKSSRQGFPWEQYCPLGDKIDTWEGVWFCWYNGHFVSRIRDFRCFTVEETKNCSVSRMTFNRPVGYLCSEKLVYNYLSVGLFYIKTQNNRHTFNIYRIYSFSFCCPHMPLLFFSRTFNMEGFWFNLL